VKIGIDIGNVIIGGGGEDTFFTEEYLWTPEVPGAHDSLYELTDLHELHFVSKCGKTTEQKTMEWLYVNKYYYIIDNQRVHFVRKRHLKAPMAQALELEIFIDDRQDVLEHMVGIVPNLILFTSWEQTNAELEKIIFAAQG
jgi:hypothetical protein